MGNKKKIAIFATVLLVILMGILITDKLTNNKISKLTSLFYLFLTSPKEVSFDTMRIKIPYNYTSSVDNETLVLLEYINTDAIIIFKKTKLLNSEEFFSNYTFRAEKLNFAIIKTISKSIKKNKLYVITAHKSSPPEYKEYIYIPSQKVIIEYIGEEDSRLDLWNLLQSSIFVSRRKEEEGGSHLRRRRGVTS